MSNDNYFLKKSNFTSGKLFTGFLQDEPDSRDFKFLDLMKKNGQIKTVKKKIRKRANLKRGIYRKASYAKSLETVEIVTEDILINLPFQIDHSKNMSSVKNQGRLGSCVGFASVAMKECQEKEEHEREITTGKKDHRAGKEYDLSEQWVYWNCKKIDSWPNEEGTSIRCAMKVLKQIGVPTENAWPYTDSKINVGEPKRWAKLIARWAAIQSYWRIDNLAELKTALAESPIVIGVPVFEEWFNPVKGLISYPSNPYNILGGHAIACVGYDDSKEVVKFKNSWSSNWGYNGYGYLSYSYLNDFLWDAWVAKDVSVTRNMIKGTRELVK